MFEFKYIVIFDDCNVCLYYFFLMWFKINVDCVDFMCMKKFLIGI